MKLIICIQDAGAVPAASTKVDKVFFGGGEIGSTGTEGKVEITVWLPKGQSYNCQR